MTIAMRALHRVTQSRPVRRLAAPVVRQLPVGVRRGLYRRLGRRHAPKLSVVVPAYNVENYIARALESLTAQTLGNWEAIVVNDGSTDRSAEIAESYARSDSRIRVIHQENGGLGAARNTGIRNAAGTYLTFLDADDLIPSSGYKVAVDTLRKTGSDFAIGATQRFDNATKYTPGWSRHLHSRPMLQITPSDFPDVMMDIIAGNRVFKRSFWDGQIGEFPTRVAYEDHRVMVTALIRANTFDILSTVTYLWRVRQDGDSISQQKMDLQNLLDRIRAHAEAFAVLQGEAHPTAISAWLTRVLDIDVPLFAEHTAVAGAEYRHAAQEFAQRYVARADPDVWAGVRWHQRVISLLMAAGRWTDIEQFRVDLRGRTGVPGTKIDATGVRLDMGRWHGPAADLLTGRDLLGERHTRLFARVDHQEWVTEGLRLAGFAYIAHVEPDSSATLNLTLVNQRTGITLIAPQADPIHSSYANRFANHPYFDYSGAGFAVVLDREFLASLFTSDDANPTDSWELWAGLIWRGIARSAVVDTTRRYGSAGTLRSELLPEHAISIAPVRVDGAIHLEARRVYVALEEVHAESEELAGLVAVPPSNDSVPTQIGTGTDGVPLHHTPENAPNDPAWTTYRFGGLRPNRAGTERPKVTFSNGDERRLGFNLGTTDPHMLPSFVVRPSHFGFVDIRPAPLGLARGAGYDANTLTVEVECSCVEPQGARFMLHHSATGAILDADDVRTTDDDTVAVTFHLDRRGANGQALRGSYQLLAGNAPVIPSTAVLGTLPHTTVTDAYRVELGRRSASQNGVLTVTFEPPLEEREHGPWAQWQLQEWFRSEQFEPRHGILFQCYRGEVAADSQRAIHEELTRQGTDLDLYWAVRDGTVTIPDQGIPVIIGSRRWYEILGSVEYLCNNIDFDRFFVRRQHQRFLQTFHGHPFKAMGKSYWQTMLNHGPALVEHEAQRRQQLWTATVMPNAHAASYYETEYGIEPSRHLVTGYPRNDAIVTGDATAARRRVSSELDLASSGYWVLHAPTWREASATGTWSAIMFDDLDLQTLTDALGPDWTVLIRGHNHNAREAARTTRQDTVVDVTDYPEINDLILAADAAVLDYSSLRFDWAITRKPLVFFVPDKAEYLRWRPGLFDFDESAPGRQVVTTDAVAAALLESDHYENEYGAHLDRFNARFNPLADGHATERVIDQFIGRPTHHAESS